MKLRIAGAIALVLAAQLTVLAVMVGRHQMTLNEGTRVILKTEPIDPRSLFRGDYAILNYDISGLSESLPGGDADWKRYDTIHVVLEREKPYWKAVSMHRNRPVLAPDQVAIRGTVRDVWSRGVIWVRYGIEKYFVPEGEGRKIERPSEGNVISIEVAVDDAGNAGITAVLLNGEPVYEEALF